MTLKRVLIVDDMPEIRRFLIHFFERSDDFDVVAEAGDGQEALTQAMKATPDVVLLDLNMPGKTGLEALPQLRQILPDAIIVIFSGYESVAIADKTKELGADAYIEKGTAASELLDRLRELVVDGPG